MSDELVNEMPVGSLDNGVPDTDDFVSQFSEKLGFEVPEGLRDTQKLSSYISSMSDRAAMADDYEQRLAAQTQELTNWREWQAQQEYNAQQSEQQEQKSASQQQADVRRWQMSQAVDTRFLETDARTGLWKAPQGYPELYGKAEEANRALKQRQEFTEQLYTDPYSFTKELVSPAMSELEMRLMERINALEGQIQPVAQRSYQPHMNQFENDNQQILYAEDPGDPGKLVWSVAGELYQDYMQLGASPADAIQLAYQRVWGSPQQQAAQQYEQAEPTSASEVKNSWLRKAKAVSRETGQPTQAAGTIATALRNGDSQTTNKLTGRAKYKQYVQEAEQELSESMLDS